MTPFEHWMYRCGFRDHRGHIAECANALLLSREWIRQLRDGRREPSPKIKRAMAQYEQQLNEGKEQR